MRQELVEKAKEIGFRPYKVPTFLSLYYQNMYLEKEEERFQFFKDRSKDICYVKV